MTLPFIYEWSITLCSLYYIFSKYLWHSKCLIFIDAHWWCLTVLLVDCICVNLQHFPRNCEYTWLFLVCNVNVWKHNVDWCGCCVNFRRTCSMHMSPQCSWLCACCFHCWPTAWAAGGAPPLLARYQPGDMARSARASARSKPSQISCSHGCRGVVVHPHPHPLLACALSKDLQVSWLQTG